MWVQTQSGTLGAAQVPTRPPPPQGYAIAPATTSETTTNDGYSRRLLPPPPPPDRPAPELPPTTTSTPGSPTTPRARPPAATRCLPELDFGPSASAPPAPDDRTATTSNFRDSVCSILDDPFFLRYSTVGSGSSGGGGSGFSFGGGSGAPIFFGGGGAFSSSDAAAAADDNGERNDHPQRLWPPPRKESLTVASPQPWFDYLDAMDSINIAVIGANGVGKSAFIQRALRLPRAPSLNVTSLRQDVDGSPHVVTLIELDLEVFDVDPAQPIQWPKQIGGHIVPRVDGALILYDVMNKDSIRDLPPTMSALAHSGLITSLVATKCDTPDNLRQLDTDGVAAAFPSAFYNFKTAANVPGSARDSLYAMLRAIASKSGGGRISPEKTDPPARRRAASTANLDAPPDTINGRPLSQQSAKHSRASSDLSLLRGLPPPSNESYYPGQSRSPRLDYQNQAHFSSSSLSSDAPDDGASRTVSSMLRTPGVRLDSVHGQESFLDMDESDADSFRYSDDIPILQRGDESLLDRPKLVGATFDDLVDRLLAPRMSRADNNFAEIFLCLYRQFAAPGQLFSAILARLDRVKKDSAAHYLTKTETQFRIIEVIAKWLALYPGDFARPVTRRKLEALVGHLSTEPVFSAAAQQMRVHLETKVMEDDDTDWANADDPDADVGADDAGGPGAGERCPLPESDSRRPSELAESMSSMQLDEAAQRRPSQSSELSQSEREAGAGRSPARFQFHSFEDYEREAATMVPTGQLPLNKFRYHIFMDIDPDDIADEMTRIDWVMFSSIRIRDLVRHVSLSVDARERCRSLRNVNRMIAHFNHVAKWVANMILIRDKAKHRAPCLEKFMTIALKLRQLNNYNGLAAVLAGINGTAIHRLGQTRALISADTQKRFARLVLLMGTQKSHFAYRLAWENSPLPRIPFIPLHRRDLVSAEEGSRTFVGPNGDRVNWRKFEVLGEVLLPIMRSQGQPYPNLNRHEPSRELILDCRMSHDEEDLYQRSVQVEPTSGMAAESSKKKFAWLVKGAQ